MFKINDNTPIAALTVRQFKDMILEIIKPELDIIKPKLLMDEFPEVIGKKEC